MALIVDISPFKDQLHIKLCLVSGSAEEHPEGLWQEALNIALYTLSVTMEFVMDMWYNPRTVYDVDSKK